MKKLLFTASLALLTLSASAQDSEYQLPDGMLAVEIQANPFGNDFNTFKMAELKARLFLNNTSAVRFGLGFGVDKDKSDNNWSVDNRADDPKNYTTIYNSGTTKTNQKALKISLGYEYHFATTGRLDFYAGGELGYEAKFYSGSSNTDQTKTVYGTGGIYSLNSNYGTGGSYSGNTYYPNTNRTEGQTTVTEESTNYDYEKMTPNGNKQNEHSIFANIFTGVDFYVYKGLYIGTELGISFKNGKSSSGSYTSTSTRMVTEGNEAKPSTNTMTTYDSSTGITKYTDFNNSNNDTTTASRISDSSSSSTHLKIYIEPALRLGWIF